MNSQGLIIRSTWCGWAIYLTDGQQLARFCGPGAHSRAMRYVHQISTISHSSSVRSLWPRRS